MKNSKRTFPCCFSCCSKYIESGGGNAPRESPCLARGFAGLRLDMDFVGTRLCLQPLKTLPALNRSHSHPLPLCSSDLLPRGLDGIYATSPIETDCVALRSRPNARAIENIQMKPRYRVIGIKKF